MNRPLLLSFAFLMAGGTLSAADIPVETFHSYVDSDICARLMLGPISASRVSCSQQTVKDGAGLVLVRLQNNMVLTPNKDKLLKKLEGQYAQATGQVKAKDGSVKLQDLKAEDPASIPAGDPARKIMDVRNYRTEGGAKLHEKIRHELAMMPYISEYDFISFTMIGSDVILTGWTVRQTNRDEAFNRVKTIEGVGNIVNNIDILPLGSMDMQIRAGVRASLQRVLSRYFWGNGSDIKIVVKNGDVILIGAVASKADSDMANIQANSVRGAFHIFNLLKVVEPAKKENKG